MAESLIVQNLYKYKKFNYIRITVGIYHYSIVIDVIYHSIFLFIISQ